MPDRALAQTSPPNDNFADQAVLVGASAAATGSITGCTLEPDERAPFHVLGTVWYGWTAPQDGSVSFRIFSTNFTPSVHIQTGSTLTGLTSIAYLHGPRGKILERNFQVAAGGQYVFQTGASVPVPWPRAEGAFQIQLNYNVPTVTQVIHISVDGLASLHLQQIMAGCPSEFPTFWRLVTNGASTFNARCDHFSSITMPNHASMFTGRPVFQPEGMPGTTHHGLDFNYDDGGTLHSSGNPNLAYQTSVFDVVHDHGLTTALFASKSKFQFFARSWDADHGAEDVMGVDNGRGKIDAVLITDGGTNPPSYTASAPLVDAMVHVLQGQSNGWHYAFIHFAETDYTGHFYGWGSPAWSNAVRHVDQQLGRILEAVEQSPALSNRVAIIVTTDHGGLGFGHGNPAERFEYTIPFFLRRAGIPGGTDAYNLFRNRRDPGTNLVEYGSSHQPLRNGDAGNLALELLGLMRIPGSMMTPQLEVSGYSLSMDRAGQNLVISWPAEAAGYTLVSSESCSPDAVWQPITEGIALAGIKKVYSISATTAAEGRFFRLQRPTALSR